MPDDRRTSAKIVVGVDGRDAQFDALALADELAGLTGATLVAAHVHPERDASVAEAETVVRSAAARAERPVEARLVADDSPSRGLHRLAEEEGAELLVAGSCHRGPVGRVLLGSVSERLLHGAPCPVAIAPAGFADSRRPVEEIAVAFDGGHESRAALDVAVGLARRAGAGIVLYRVSTPPAGVVYPGIGAGTFASIMDEVREQERRALDQVVAGLPEEVRPRGEMLGGPTADALTTASAAAGLLVVGSHGRGAVGSVVLGSTARAIVRDASCPVVVVPRGLSAGAVPAGGEARTASA